MLKIFFLKNKNKYYFNIFNQKNILKSNYYYIFNYYLCCLSDNNACKLNLYYLYFEKFNLKFEVFEKTSKNN
jgi:hypothetical protein